MGRSLRRENIKHYNHLLKTVMVEVESRRIVTLRTEEQKKQKNFGDAVEDE